jgi:hypothetical protein
MRMKTEAMKLCAPSNSAAPGSLPAFWQSDATLMDWLSAL